MRAAVLTEYGEPLDVRDVESPAADADGIVVETEACGVCRSDWHAWQGDWDWIGAKPPEGQILGHEPAGTVVEVGSDVEHFDVGDRVAVPFTLGDGTCPHCRRGDANVCENLRPLGFTPQAPGAFAERFPVPDADFNAVKLPDGVDPVDMAALGCRFTTAFHGLAHRANVEGGDWVAVHGCGGVGLSAVHIAEALGARVVAVDLDEATLERAESLGAEHVVHAGEVDHVPGAVQELTDGGADVAVDALGIAETCRNSVASLGRKGKHVQIGLTTGEEGGEVSLPTDSMVMREVDFLASFGMPPARYDEILSMVESGQLDPGAIVSETVSLDEVSETLDAMSEFDTVGVPVVTEF
ncbi:zinc-dependent alcohol dehydrogenase family protein [Halospeciosus flavus]|uniref:Zinc-dependent alcohol dehydrogenase family protein n=1 Tax=Halospeciosus flavus TaxID=3032283 RepID=A0ABD5Z4A8_9EURY|nr:zinc-dependent alcohol dehydrogenase family protein [Halospeciosus flavus]